ncbi:aminopeptidase O isoform X5 [Catharus ustulatus]|uniref:aminopeptidase O isoform X5 n=1 Tax=Catharus ustulatus TaxID=91951 RepID=UPI001407A851|nr:aminopeptidase O isoform X5 [Catharus ustulatus]
METQLDPMKDDLPLMANTSYMLVKHYVLDLDVDFKSKIIEGSIVLFFETGSQYKKTNSAGEESCQSQFDETSKMRTSEPCYIPIINVSTCSSKTECNDFAVSGKEEEATSDENSSHSNNEQDSGISSSKDCCDIENHGNKDFLLVLDCCDLSVLKVEEVDVAAVSGIEKFTRSAKLTGVSKELENLRNQIVHELLTLPADRWKEQLYYFTHCSQAPGCGELLFSTGTWSLEIRKSGIQTPADFPHAIRIWYKTKPEGRSVTWTTDQSGRPCVYTMGSPINNRALFPCQEPPIALSTWQASVRTAAGFIVLMSGENSAEPVQLQEGVLSWYYYVTMPMPASTFTIAVGCWQEVKQEVKQQSFKQRAAVETNTECSLPSSQTDFSPHIIFLSQSVLPGGSHLCGTRLCHEIAHAWFGLAIGARDWTEEWISEGFATFLEDIFWARAQQQLSHDEIKGQQELKALLRWRRLRDEVQNSEEELQVLRPKKESTGELSESGASIVKYGLKAEKIFMQVHYLKGYFLLRSLARTIGEVSYLASLRKFVIKFHGQLVLSQDFLSMLLEDIPEQKGSGLTVESIFQNWLDTSGIPKPLLEEGETWKECQLVQQVSGEVTKWIQTNRRIRKSGKKKMKQNEVVFLQDIVRKKERGAFIREMQPLESFWQYLKHYFQILLLPDQLVLLLECLLEEKTLCPRILQCLERTYQLQEQDAEVRHRWCELVIKHKYEPGYGDIERFLRDNQAMGVYLYGELMVNEDAKQQELARKCFAAAQEHMDASSAKVVAEMLF